MAHVMVQLNDLPDEILMYIFTKLYNVDLLYSVIGINQRFNKIVRDPKFTDCLNLLLYCPNGNTYCPLPDLIVDRFCSKILPEIGYQVKSLYLEPRSMRRILHATDYPNLNVLGLCNLDMDPFKSWLNDESSLIYALKNQISSLSICFNCEKDLREMNNECLFIFTQILTIFTDLKHLIYKPSSSWYERLYFKEAPTIVSSTLLELHVSVEEFSDCLYFLDGRFEQLRIFHVNVAITNVESSTINNKKIANLQIFSLYCHMITDNYENSIVPLLHRMTNLEQLDLTILFSCNNKCIDSDVLNKDIIAHMSRLHKFTFNIYSIVDYYNPNKLILYEHNQQIFEYFHHNEIVTCIDHFQDEGYTKCHIYSYPYQLKLYNNITNTFPGGLFVNVTKVSLYDERPFECEFFARIAQSFPYLEDLNVKNRKAQYDKNVLKLNNADQPFSIIKYSNLIKLQLFDAHDDYIELFLLEMKMFFPVDVQLFVDEKSLERVTWNFVRNETRNNCAKVAFLKLLGRNRVTERIKDYFPRICQS